MDPFNNYSQSERTYTQTRGGPGGAQERTVTTVSSGPGGSSQRTYTTTSGGGGWDDGFPGNGGGYQQVESFGPQGYPGAGKMQGPPFAPGKGGPPAAGFGGQGGGGYAPQGGWEQQPQAQYPPQGGWGTMPPQQQGGGPEFYQDGGFGPPQAQGGGYGPPQMQPGVNQPYPAQQGGGYGGPPQQGRGYPPPEGWGNAPGAGGGGYMPPQAAAPQAQGNYGQAMAGARSTPRPNVQEGIGQRHGFQRMPIDLVSHPAAEFKTNDNVFNIVVQSPQPFRAESQLFMYKVAGNSQTKMELPKLEMVLVEKQNSQVSFKLALREPGWYLFNVFAAPFNSDDTLPLVYTYLFELTGVTRPTGLFPSQFTAFIEGQCHLFSPLFLDAKSKLSNVHFKIRVPGAQNVAVIARDEWNYLVNKGDDMWEADLNLEHYRGQNTQINLAACVSDDKSNFSSLLQYTI